MHWRFPLFRHRKLERELDAELRFHLDQQIAANLARGLSPEEARRAAALEFGGLDQMKEACRDQRGLVWLDHRWQDLRYAGRQLLHARTFSATSLLTVAIGIGACTSIFSLVNAVLLKPLRLTDPDRIVTIEETRPPDREHVKPAPGAFFEWVNQTSVFEHLAAHRGLSFNSKVNGSAQNISAESITTNYFSVLGVGPLRGRVFLPGEHASSGHRFVILFMLFSGVALLLAAIGIYGVMAYSVDLRTREIGIRMALGAGARDVLLMVGRGGGRIIALGLILGVIGAVAFAHILQSLLFETSPSDPLTLFGVSLVLAVVGFIACWAPARRATKVNPVTALRTE